MSDTLPSGTDLQIASNVEFSSPIINTSESYFTSKQIAIDALPYGSNLYARTRHRHPETGISNWSNPVQFQVTMPAGIIGICFDSSGTKGIFSRIDAVGNNIVVFNHLDHAMYTGVTQVTIDTGRDPVLMTKFPLFYIKTAASGPVGTFAAGKKCWWISSTPFPGARPAAAFKRTTEKDANGKYIISPFCYMGTVLAKTVSVGGLTTMGSQISSAVAVGNSPSTCKTWIKNRNNVAAGMSGFRMFDIWDLGILRILFAIKHCSGDSQGALLTNVSLSPLAGVTSSYLFFNNTSIGYINDIWACYWCITDRYKIVSNLVQLTSPMDETAVIGFGDATADRYTVPGGGWLKDVLDCPMVIGDDTHDLMELFLPKSVTGTQANSAFSDVVTQFDKGVWSEDYVCTHGSPYNRSGYWTNSYSGLFCQCTNEYSTITSDVATRIAKS